MAALLNLIRYAAQRDEPWRNGAGSTRTLWSAGDAADPWARISVARIDRDATFSSFPGIDRTFCLLGPGCLTLLVDGTARRLQPGQWISFPGDAAVEARLAGDPVWALNVMTARGRASHEVAAASGAVEGTLLAVLAGDGAQVEPGDLIVPPHPTGLAGRFVAVRIVSPAPGPMDEQPPPV